MLVSTLLKAAFAGDRASMDLLGTDVVTMRAWPWLCDAYGHINNARYLDLTSTARLQWLVSVGAIRRVIANRYSFLVAGVAAVYRRPIPRLATFRVATRVAAYDQRWVCYEQVFLLGAGSEGQVAARFLTRGQLRNPGGALPPEEGLRKLGLEVPSERPEPPPDLEVWSATLKANLDAMRQHEAATRR
jgi:acyl-CoA thioesterase FadM